MAKQRGVVQLSGRVDNLCYYQQKRVKGGLVRRLNQAMSERAKTGEEFENFRTANSYFGACSMCAGAMLNLLGDKVRFLTKPNRQGLLTKYILEYQRTYHSATYLRWVQFEQSTADYFPLFFDRIVKNKVSDFFNGIPFKFWDVQFDSPITIILGADEIARFCAVNKCSGLAVSIDGGCHIFSIYRNVETGRFDPPDYGSQPRASLIYHKPSGLDFSFSFGTGENDDTFQFAYVGIIPFVENETTGEKMLLTSGALVRMIGIRYA